MKGDLRFAYPVTDAGQIVMPPTVSAFPGQLSALPISVDPPADSVFEPHPLDAAQTRGLVALGYPDPGPLAAERVELPDDIPFDHDDKDAEEFRKAEQATRAVSRGIREDIQAEKNLDAQLRRHQQSVFEVDRASQAALANQRTGLPMAMVSPLSVEGRTPRNTGPVPRGTEGLLPIFEPMHNAREMAKQLVLLEDHLVQPSKHCPDCIRKHLLTAEALAEEAVSLDKTGQHRDYFRSAAREVRDISRAFLADQNRGALQQRARLLRKAMSKHGFSALDKTSAQKASSVFAPLLIDESVRQDSPFRGSRAEAPSKVIPGARVAFYNGQSWLPAIVTGTPSAARVVVQPITPNSYGRQNRTVGVASVDGTSRVNEWIVPLSATPVSSELRFLNPVRFHAKTGRPMKPDTFSGEQLFFADLIQGVLERNLGPDLCKRVGISTPKLLEGYGCTRKVAQQLARAAAVTALYETGLDPSRVNRVGPDDSYGLFQLNRKGGLGQGHAPSKLLDPVYNASLFADAVSRQLRYFAPLIQREAALQPTQTGQWVQLVTKRIQRPGNMDVQASYRGRTADALFPTASAQQTTGVKLFDAGANLDLAAWAARNPTQWKYIGPAEKGIAPILRRKASPTQLLQGEPFLLSEAADLWSSSASELNDPVAMMRAAWLHRYASDMDGYRVDLESLSKMLAGTAMGTEADRLLAELKESLPKQVHTPETSMEPIQKLMIGGAAVFTAVAAFAAFKSRSM